MPKHSNGRNDSNISGSGQRVVPLVTEGGSVFEGRHTAPPGQLQDGMLRVVAKPRKASGKAAPGRDRVIVTVNGR
jgi:hypothetical protein